jgi:hypothetical protein
VPPRSGSPTSNGAFDRAYPAMASPALATCSPMPRRARRARLRPARAQAGPWSHG